VESEEIKKKPKIHLLTYKEIRKCKKYVLQKKFPANEQSILRNESETAIYPL